MKIPQWLQTPKMQWLGQFIRFGLVGVSNTVIGLAVYYLFLWIDPGLYLWGNIVGWAVSVANSYFWNNRFVFSGGRQNWKSILKKLGKSYICYAATMLLSTGLLYLEVSVWGWSARLSPIVNLLVTIPLNFCLNKFWIFRDRP